MSNNFFRATLYGIVGMMLVVSALALAAPEKKVPIPKNRPAVVTPEGGISFGETSAPMSPAAQRKFLLKYAEMTQKEIDDLTAALKVIYPPPPVMIVCKDPMCEDLALNLDNAFESARWKSEIVIGTQFGVPPGVTVSSKWLAAAFNRVTANRYFATVPSAPLAEGEYIVIGSKPR